MPPITRLQIREYGDLSPRGQLGNAPAIRQDSSLDASSIQFEEQTNVHPYSTESINRTPAPGSIVDILA